MKRLLLLTTSLCATSLALAGGIENISPPPASYVQASGPYFGIHGGANFPTEEALETGFDVGAQLGYRFNPHFRVEGAFSYLRNDESFFWTNWYSQHPRVTSIHTHQNTYLFMANALYDFHLTPVIDPFIGVGIGVNHFNEAPAGSRDVYFLGSDSTDFAYQAIAGLGFNITQNMMLSARYRFVGTVGDSPDFNIVEASFDYFI